MPSIGVSLTNLLLESSRVPIKGNNQMCTKVNSRRLRVNLVHRPSEGRSDPVELGSLQRFKNEFYYSPQTRALRHPDYKELVGVVALSYSSINDPDEVRLPHPRDAGDRNNEGSSRNVLCQYVL